jgi:hypothetical protein
LPFNPKRMASCRLPLEHEDNLALTHEDHLNLIVKSLGNAAPRRKCV